MRTIRELRNAAVALPEAVEETRVVAYRLQRGIDVATTAILAALALAALAFVVAVAALNEGRRR